MTAVQLLARDLLWGSLYISLVMKSIYSVIEQIDLHAAPSIIDWVSKHGAHIGMPIIVALYESILWKLHSACVGGPHTFCLTGLVSFCLAKSAHIDMSEYPTTLLKISYSALGQIHEISQTVVNDMISAWKIHLASCMLIAAIVWWKGAKRWFVSCLCSLTNLSN